MRTNWIGKSVVALSLAAACAVPACDSSKTEEVSRTRGAATALQAGDVAITCFNSNGTDFLQITPLVPIDSDSDIKLTDREATAAGVFNSNDENINVAVTLPSDGGVSVIPAGTPIRFTPGTGLGNGTETVFIYQGSISADADAGALTGQFLWGFQNSPGGGWAVMRNDATNVSERLTALGGNDTAVNSANNSNTWFYDTTKGPSSGTKAVLRAAIANVANWSTSGQAADPAVCPGLLNVLADATDAGNDAPVDSGAPADSGAGGAAGSADAGPGTGGVTGTGGATDSGADVTGTGGTGTGGSTDSGADVTGTGGMGTGGSTDSGADVTGTGGMGTGGAVDSGTDVTGTGGTVAGTGGSDAGAGSDASGTGGRGTGGSSGDAASDVRADTGTTTDAKVDTGTTTTDAKADTKADAKADAKTGGGSSGCSCSTTGSTSDSLGISAWMLALGGVIFTARRRRRKQ